MKVPCKDCGCRYSSYCVDCKYRAFGLGLVEVQNG